MTPVAARMIRPPLRLLGLGGHRWVVVIAVICLVIVLALIARYRR